MFLYPFLISFERIGIDTFDKKGAIKHRLETKPGQDFAHNMYYFDLLSFDEFVLDIRQRPFISMYVAIAIKTTRD